MWSTKRLIAVWACRPGVGNALSKTWGAAGSCTSSWQHLQAHLPRICRCTKNCAGTMSSRSLMSSPTRTIGLPHSGVGQFVSSGSMRCSTRARCSGSASRLGWRRGCLSAAAGPGVELACRAASWASRLAWSAAKVSSKISRCSAFMRSVLAPNRQALSRASCNVMLSILASRHLMPRACESIRLSCASMRLVCSPMWASICEASSVHSVGLRAFRSRLLTACRSSMLHCASPIATHHRGLFLLQWAGRHRANSHSTDASQLLQALPWQPEHQGVELLWAQGERGRVRRCTSGPLEAALVQSPRGAPHAKAVVHQQLDAAGAGVGKEVAVVRQRGAEDLYHAGQQPVNAGAHVDGVDRQPDGVDPNHRSSSRIHAAHCEAAAHGQLTLMAIGPRRSSMRMSVGTAWAGGNCTGTKAVATAPLTALANAPPPRRSASRTQRRARFALTPWAIATAALDTPGELHAATTCALNSALWVRRRRRTHSAEYKAQVVAACNSTGVSSAAVARAH